MDLNKIEMLGDWVLVETPGPQDEGVVVKSVLVNGLDDETKTLIKKPIIPIGTFIKFRSGNYGGKTIHFEDGQKLYVAVSYGDIVYKETK
jgi:hypothetical protein